MFYIVTPSQYNDGDVNYTLQEIWPFFLLFILLENIILYMKKKSFQRFNDGVTSIAHGIFHESARIMSKGAENWLYCYLYENYRIINLQWTNPVTWYTVAVFVDFCYYWFHRASHEIHILWAQHQVHHSSEDFNLAVGLRQPFLHAWCGFVFYLPMAFFVPPVQFLIHQKLNFLYQFWIHTATIDDLGPIEYIFNTPHHHRVHHGSNLIYLDKNYGGVLIIWDKLFGTFAEYSSKQNIIYGLVHQPATFNPLYQQVFYFNVVYSKWRSMHSWLNKLQCLIKGPSWRPGSPWTGRNEDKFNVQSRIKYDPHLSWSYKLYLSVHMIMSLYFFYNLPTLPEITVTQTLILYLIYILGELTIFGMFLDKQPKAVCIEIVRCCVTSILVKYFSITFGIIDTYCCIFYSVSAVFWTHTYISDSYFS